LEIAIVVAALRQDTKALVLLYVGQCVIEHLIVRLSFRLQLLNVPDRPDQAVYPAMIITLVELNRSIADNQESYELKSEQVIGYKQRELATSN
jgi:hypothetical protein